MCRSWSRAVSGIGPRHHGHHYSRPPSLSPPPTPTTLTTKKTTEERQTQRQLWMDINGYGEMTGLTLLLFVGRIEFKWLSEVGSIKRIKVGQRWHRLLLRPLTTATSPPPPPPPRLWSKSTSFVDFRAQLRQVFQCSTVPDWTEISVSKREVR